MVKRTSQNRKKRLTSRIMLTNWAKFCTWTNENIEIYLVRKKSPKIKKKRKIFIDNYLVDYKVNLKGSLEIFFINTFSYIFQVTRRDKYNFGNEQMC